MLSLKTLKQYLQTKSMVSLQELQNVLQEDAQTTRCLLQHFIARGQVMERNAAANCGSCQKCPGAQRTLYVWLNNSASCTS